MNYSALTRIAFKPQARRFLGLNFTIPHYRPFSNAIEKPKTFFETLVAADQTLSQTKLFHKTNYACAVLVPVAFIAHPSFLSLPADLFLSLLLPLHAHMGMNWIFTDYVPTSPTGPTRIALLAFSILASLGLIKLSFTEEGILGSLKLLWTPKKAEK